MATAQEKYDAALKAWYNDPDSVGTSKPRTSGFTDDPVDTPSTDTPTDTFIDKPPKTTTQIPIESKTITTTQGSAVPNNLGIQTIEQQEATREAMLTNVTDPQIPEAGEQTYTPLKRTANQLLTDTGKLVDSSGDTTAATVQNIRTVASPGTIDAARYGASTISTQTPVAAAATGAVSKLVNPATGAISHEAVAAQGVLDPASLVEAATARISPDGKAVAQTADLESKATMITQLNGLLSELEGGNVPAWARPAVDQVEDALAKRGLSKSSIGRDALFNAIIQAALPIAQNDAQAYAQRGAQNLSNRQQTALFNAQNVVQMDLANLSNEQQARLANSQALQTITLANLNNAQQAAMTNAANWAAMDTANLSAAMTAQVENARNFLQMDLTNVNNAQQANIINQQMKMQALLSDQAAKNAARQFNASNQTQVDMFTKSLQTQVSQFNTQQVNNVRMFNKNEQNAMRQFEEQSDFARETFNANMYAQIEQSNVTWRRQMNQIDTAGVNAVNQANAINAFNLSNQALTLTWQDLRDTASWAFQAGENDQERNLRLAQSMMTSEQNKASLEAQVWASAGEWLRKVVIP